MTVQGFCDKESNGPSPNIENDLKKNPFRLNYSTSTCTIFHNGLI